MAALLFRLLHLLHTSRSASLAFDTSLNKLPHQKQLSVSQGPEPLSPLCIKQTSRPADQQSIITHSNPDYSSQDRRRQHTYSFSLSHTILKMATLQMRTRASKRNNKIKPSKADLAVKQERQEKSKPTTQTSTSHEVKDDKSETKTDMAIKREDDPYRTRNILACLTQGNDSGAKTSLPLRRRVSPRTTHHQNGRTIRLIRQPKWVCITNNGKFVRYCTFGTDWTLDEEWKAQARLRWEQHEHQL